MTSSLRLQIVGSGAIGSLMAAGAECQQYAYGLAPRAGSQVTREVLLHNQTRVVLEHNQGEKVCLTESDILVLPLKVYQLDTAIAYWKPRLAPATPVVLLHNGMGGLEILRRHLPTQRVYQATTSHGALKNSPTQVRHTGLGHTMLGVAPDNQSTDMDMDEQLQFLFSRCLPPTEWQSDMQTALWRKLAVNAVINPLTALYNLPNGGLLNESFASLIEPLCIETQRVAHACGVPLTLTEITTLVYRVIEGTANNYSSMHQDVTHHRPTEIEAINGYLVSQALKKGIDVPINTLLVEQISALR